MLNNENNIQNITTRTENKIIVASLKWKQMVCWLAVNYWENYCSTFNVPASVKTFFVSSVKRILIGPFCSIRHSTTWNAHKEGQQIVYY